MAIKFDNAQQHLNSAAMPKETKHFYKICFALSYMYGMYFFKYETILCSHSL